MKLGRPQILEWFSLQLAIACGGAVAAIVNPWLGLLLGGLSLPLNFMLLQQGWRTRDDPSVNKPMADAIAVGGMGLFVVLLLRGDTLLALMALLYIATLAMAVQLDSHRKFYVAQTVSFVFVFAGAAEATTGAYLLVLIAYCLTAVFALTEVWLDRGGDVGQLPGPSLGQRARIAVITMAVAVVVYLLLPRFEALNYGGQVASADDYYHNAQWLDEAGSEPATSAKPGRQDGQRQEDYEDLKSITDLSGYGDDTQDSYRYTGFNEKFDINTPQSGRSLPPETVVLNMKAPHGTYLKVRSFDTFDGLTWSTANENIDRKLSSSAGGEIQIDTERSGNFQHTISVRERLPAWLPVAGDPVTLWVPSSVVALDQFGQPLLPGPLHKGTSYTVDSRLDLLDKRNVSKHAPATSQDLQIPKGFDPAIRELAKSVTRQLDSDMARAEALEHHLRSSYRYSLESAMVSQNRTPLSEFLFQTREGHCEYFASAMTMMLRSIRIPARLVTGFSATVRNPLTGYFDVRVIDGHAWTEAWIDGRWITFEPTAYYSLPEPGHTPVTAEQIRQYTEEMLRQDAVISDGEFSVTGLLGSIWITLYTAVVIVLAWLRLVLETLWPLWVALAALAVTALFTTERWWPWWRAWRSLQRIRNCPAAAAEDTLHFCLFHLQQTACVRAEPRARDEAVRDWAQRVVIAIGDNPSLLYLRDEAEGIFHEGRSGDAGAIRAAATDAATLLMNQLRGRQ